MLLLDEDDPLLDDYLSIVLPASWTHRVGRRRPLSALYNAAYKRLPQAAWWGFIADDVVPATPNWDQRLVAIAGADGMAVPHGSHDDRHTPHFVLGGDLVRSIGWLAVPGLDRLYIDTIWQEIAMKRGVLRVAPDVILWHHHFSNGLALMDSIYRKRRKAEDRAIYKRFKQEFLDA